MCIERLRPQRLKNIYSLILIQIICYSLFIYRSEIYVIISQFKYIKGNDTIYENGYLGNNKLAPSM